MRRTSQTWQLGKHLSIVFASVRFAVRSQNLLWHKSTKNKVACLMPKGKVWLRRRSRLMSGHEKLALQGCIGFNAHPGKISEGLAGAAAGNAFNGFMFGLIELGLHAAVPMRWSP